MAAGRAGRLAFFLDGAMKQEILAFIGRLKDSHEINALNSKKRNELTNMLKSLGTKFILGTMEPEEVVEILCAFENALRSGAEAEVNQIAEELRKKLSCTEQSVQGEVCALRPKKKKVQPLTG